MRCAERARRSTAAASILEPSAHSVATRSRSCGGSDALVARCDLAAHPAFGLHGSRLLYPRTHDSAPLPSCRSLERRHLDGREHHVHVDPVEQRAAHLRAVGADALGRATAASTAVAQPAAGAGIHRADEQEPRGERRLGVGTRDGDDAVFERLTQGLERATPELGQLVEEEDTVVGEADLAGARTVAPADEPDLADRVVRRAEGARARQALGPKGGPRCCGSP